MNILNTPGRGKKAKTIVDVLTQFRVIPIGTEFEALEISPRFFHTIGEYGTLAIPNEMTELLKENSDG